VIERISRLVRRSSKSEERVIRSWHARKRKSGANGILAIRCLSNALPFRAVRPYLSPMTKLLEKALEAVRRLPPDSPDEIALAMLTLSGHEGEPEEIDPAHLPAVLEGLAQAKRRQFASDAEVEAAFRRFEQ
jgi:hypothetical protein